MTIYEDTNSKPLLDLLDRIDSGDMLLPDFQRNFVWEPSATQALIVSIANNYPAGSILRVRDRQRAFSSREFEGAPAARTDHTFLVLDGQQRLTSLYQAFYGVGDHRYYLDMRGLIDGNDFEDSIHYLRHNKSAVARRAEFTFQAQELIVPLAVLHRGSTGFSRWSAQVARTRQGEERDRLEDQLHEIEEKWINRIDQYVFPVVTLSAETEPAALCTIFETLNRTGVKLSVFELLTARFWSHDLRLRDLWEQARAEHPLISRFDVDPYYLLMAIALAGGQARSCKRGDVLNLTADTVIHWWPRVVKAMDRALTILVDDCWVLQPRWLPYATMLPPMAAALACVDDTRGAAVGAQREQIRRWFWCSVFSQAYENAPNTQSTRDVNELIAWFQDPQAQPPETVRSFRFNPNHLREVTPRQRSLYRATICLMLASGNAPLDFHTRAVLNHQLLDSSGIDDHHIFPDKFLADRGLESRQRDIVLNRCLIDRSTNQHISCLAPSTYMAELRDQPDFPMKLVLQSHLIPCEPESGLWADNFDTFQAQRQELIASAISKATTGVVAELAN
ncbi:DUF262 domain-containing protein [Synechococcus sp. Cruz-9H2]|uniref:GmrSD restriction endonuclease domain-containing protein n=1 Tax=unclassified Synechococcus TaxID=2626047 RepID=UPI0020CF264C|nr:MULTISPECIES: DUF262 domain-containing protein [unclassified Synechococcus]MCP9820006.1 DUF262 domain-containing protein [Synechococcus sp. Cruz-9H2]MCP9844312.1 DUF262 domain-containing protein [Synechococcus sp. Edmonson 11F2]MCP9856436.1 DUF262 domain-containing protein [Synechococcus sp. Cruz-9C9]MCP9863789.1 DUF262 domain-containing protein [Synechococcus sp. Cruz-7E5]MCP9870916.1 DUF262 domain-containing protein [Synechococcus sp. Cruz-7B9]